MNILIVSNLYPPVVYGGYELLCRQVVDALRDRGHAVQVLTSVQAADEVYDHDYITRSLVLTTPFPAAGENVGYVDFRLQTLNHVAQINYKRTLRALSEWWPDVVFCWCMNRLSLGPVLAAQKRHLPVCYTINDEHPRQFHRTRSPRGIRQQARRLAEWAVWPMSTFRCLDPIAITVISESLKWSLVRQGVSIQQAEVIHQGVDLEELPFCPLARKPGEPLRVCYVGQLSEVKGVHTILQAMAMLKERGPYTLDIIGTGVPHYEMQLRDIVEADGMGDYVHFAGPHPHEEIASIYHNHHVLVFSSEWAEPFGLSHLEAMACGCAVISTTTGGSGELIEHEENALAYEAGDPGALAAVLRSFETDELLRGRLVRSAREDVEQNYCFQAYVDKLAEFLRQAVDASVSDRLGGVGGNDRAAARI